MVSTLGLSEYIYCMCNYTIISYSATFRDESNQTVVSKLINEVHGVNPTFQACDIRGKIHINVI